LGTSPIPDKYGGYDNDPGHYTEVAGFRYIAFMTALWAPIAIFVVELFFNQLLISWKQLPMQYIFTFGYAVMTLSFQKFTGNAVIFPKRLDWNSDNLFSECILWFIVFILVQTGCFSLVLLIHFLKSKFCCKRSVEIVTFREIDAKDMGALTAKQE